MAMGDPVSDRIDWVQLYHQQSSSFPTQQLNQVSPASSTVSNDAPNVAISTAPAALQPAERRVGKPARRRTRASRKAPTTLVNTDTSNFRAMVQQYTGVPTPPPAYPQPTTAEDFQRLPPEQSIPMQFGVPPPPLLHRPTSYPPQQHHHAATSNFFQGYSNGNSSSSSNNNNIMSSYSNERGGNVGSAGGFDRYLM